MSNVSRVRRAGGESASRRPAPGELCPAASGLPVDPVAARLAAMLAPHLRSEAPLLRGDGAGRHELFPDAGCHRQLGMVLVLVSVGVILATFALLLYLML